MAGDFCGRGAVRGRCCAEGASGGARHDGQAKPAIWIDVPFVAQTKNGCGPASIAMVMQYWQRKARGGAARLKSSDSSDPEKAEAAPATPLPPAAVGEPMRASEMEKAFRRGGYRAFAFQATWGDLEHHLGLGRPLIVALGASGPLGPLHYAVVAGMDSENGYVFLNDSARQKMLRLSRAGFASEWRRSGNWTLLAVPAAAVRPARAGKPAGAAGALGAASRE